MADHALSFMILLAALAFAASESNTESFSETSESVSPPQATAPDGLSKSAVISLAVIFSIAFLVLVVFAVVITRRKLRHRKRRKEAGVEEKLKEDAPPV
jgi:heme/copper-type cytochrome/quinol oxidase subunit 2